MEQKNIFENQINNTLAFYHKISDEQFSSFLQKYNFPIKQTNTIKQSIYHIIFWLYHQFNPILPIFNEFQKYNGFEIFEQCKKSYSPNCACYAIMLNDLLLGFGFKSKAVWCLSDDPNDTECHALNHVFDPESKTWFVADPSSRSVICNENAIPIDLLTLRNSIQNGGIVYPHRNKTIRQSSDFILEYNEYMKKNSFQFLTQIEQGLSYPLEETAVLIHPIGYEENFKRPWKRTTNIRYLYD